MKKVFIDTNILLRYLTKDDPLQYPHCRNLFKKAQNGEMLLVTSTLVIADLIWTLCLLLSGPQRTNHRKSIDYHRKRCRSNP